MVLQTSEDDHHRLEVRDAATAALVERAERAIARANQPVRNGLLWGFETLQACGRAGVTTSSRVSAQRITASPMRSLRSSLAMTPASR